LPSRAGAEAFNFYHLLAGICAIDRQADCALKSEQAAVGTEEPAKPISCAPVKSEADAVILRASGDASA
jgi:hypothetical protein